MSASKNPDGANPPEGEFRSRVPATAPMTTKGHAPGTQVGAPEFHLETHPAGTAPAEHSYTPNTEAAVPGGPDAGTRTPAEDTLSGATSRDVHNASDIGRPAQGQSSRELHGGKGGEGADGA